MHINVSQFYIYVQNKKIWKLDMKLSRNTNHTEKTLNKLELKMVMEHQYFQVKSEVFIVDAPRLLVEEIIKIIISKNNPGFIWS